MSYTLCLECPHGLLVREAGRLVERDGQRTATPNRVSR
jgi:hypothetical protein